MTSSVVKDNKMLIDWRIIRKFVQYLMNQKMSTWYLYRIVLIKRRN